MDVPSPQPLFPSFRTMERLLGPGGGQGHEIESSWLPAHELSPPTHRPH